MNITLLTGAGISAESGIRTFRATGGLWEEYPISQVATPEGFAADPALVHRFYNARRAALADVAPNPAHIALAKLQAQHEGEVTIITQNVDDLHERGGAALGLEARVIHMHGTLTQMLCGACGSRWHWTTDAGVETVCPSCGAHLPTPDPLAVPRPDIVWFGEMPYHMETIEAAVQSCDLFVSIGTSGEVYPAAGLVAMARSWRKRTLEINLEPSGGTHLFDESRQGKAGTLVPEWVEEVLDP